MKKIILISALFFISIWSIGCKKDCGGSCNTGDLVYNSYTFYMTNGDSLPYHDFIWTQINGVNMKLIPVNLKEIKPEYYHNIGFAGGYPVKYCYEETGDYVEFEWSPNPPHDDINIYPLVRLCSIEFNQ